MNRYRLAVAGCGTAAFGLHLPVLAAHPGFDLAAVCDRAPGRAETAAARFTVPRVAAVPADLLEGADMLLVLTGVHDDLIETALSAGVHVFTEKPVSLDLARTRRLRAQATGAGLVLEVGAMRAHDPALHALLAAVPRPAGGWLIKSDGIDKAARQAMLPAGFAPYTFDADPPQQLPAGLVTPQATALKVLLWEGYHQLTALTMAAGSLTPVTCSLSQPDLAVHATIADQAGHLFTLIIGRPPAGAFTDQMRLLSDDHDAWLGFPPPYTAGAAASLAVDGGRPATGFTDPFAAMWKAIHARLDGSAARADSAALAGQVEELALRLARKLTPVPAQEQGNDDHA